MFAAQDGLAATRDINTGRNIKGGNRGMKGTERIKAAFALMAVLAMSGTGWAKPSFGGPGISGELNGPRTEATVDISLPAFTGCDTLNTLESYAVKAYIFQPSGRMFAIGISDPTSFTCSSTTQVVVQDVLVKGFPGLSFKPGPATLLFQVTLTEDDGDVNTPPVDSVIYEFGSRVDLH
jgi:hypothetical protein